METTKQLVHDYWNHSSCGETYAIGKTLHEKLYAQEQRRYELEPFISGFAKFEQGYNRDVLEIGVGMGADHLQWAKHKPRNLTGIDLTSKALEFTRNRLFFNRFQSNLIQADAENLPYADSSFDIVYSWGVLHHSPDTAKAISEVFRVLKPGGVARIMVYNRYSIVGFLLWLRYAKFKKSLDEIYCNFLESPGTKAFTIQEAEKMFEQFKVTEIDIELSVGDLLEGNAGQRHRGPLLTIAKAFWPRKWIRRNFKDLGLFMMIEATK